MNFISNVSEINKLKDQEKFSFKCFKCHNICTVLVRSKKKQIQIYKNFGGLICTNCKFQLVYPRDQAAKKHRIWHASLSKEEKRKIFDKMVKTKKNWSDERKHEYSRAMSEANNRLTDEQKLLKLRRFHETNLNKYGDIKPSCSTGSQKFKDVLIKKYGVDTTDKIPGMHDKIIKSIVLNSGYTGDISNINSPMQIPEIRKKIENTNFEKLGVNLPFQSVDIREKSKKVREEKYGDPNYTNRIQAEETFKKNHNNMTFAEYGGSKECQQKISDTCLKKYHVKHYSFTDEFKEKTKQTCLNKYGNETYFGSDDYFEKTEKTCLSRYHNSTYFGSDDYFKKNEKTCLREYMNPTYFGSKEFLDRMMNTYGTLHPSHTYNYYGIFFDSSWELAIWIYCIDHNIPISKASIRFIYNYDNKAHYYEPDFLINDELVEIKGDQFLDKSTGKWINPYDHSLDGLYEAKHQCAINNGVKVLYSSECKEYVDYCNTKYPNWDKIFLSDNFENPSYFKFVYCIPNTGVSIYDINKNDDYTVVKNKGMSPFDIGLKTRK